MALALLAGGPPVDPAQGPTEGGTEVVVAAPYAGPVQIVGNSLANFALDGAGTVTAWGIGYLGGLGTGSTDDQLTPVPIDTSGVLAGKEIVRIATSGYTTLVRDVDGGLYTWGIGSSGELGDGTLTDQALSPVAVDMTGVLAGKTIVDFGAGDGRMTVLADDGTLYSWGTGALGRGVDETSAVPVAVDMTGALAGKTIVDLEASGGSTFAIDSEGVLYAWGGNYYGQLGDGTTVDRYAPVPVDMSGLLNGKRVTQVAAGSEHTVAMASDGGLYSWGRNAGGRLGNGSFIGDSLVPVAVDMTGALAGLQVAFVSAGSSTNFAVTTEGEAYGWGTGGNGELGDGAKAGSAVPTPLDMSGALAGKRIVSLYSSTFVSFAITDDGASFGWGSGRFGDGGYEQALTPIAMSDPVPDVVTVAFDGVPGEVVRRLDHRTVLVRTPAHVSAVVDVTVTVDEADPVTHPAAFTFGTAPQVVVHPVDAAGSLGDPVTLTAEATGDEAPSGTWEVSTDEGASWTPLLVPTASAVGNLELTLALDLTEALDGALVRASFTNGLGSAVSDPARLTVTAPVPPSPEPTPPEPTPGTPAPTPPASPVATPTGTGHAGWLPRTGAEVAGLVGLASVLLALGAGAVWIGSRRRRS